VSPRYLYAILGAAPAAPLGTGMADEPLRLIACDGLFAAAGEMTAAPALTPDALRGHDRVVRRLATLAEAVLPARFGALADDDDDLCDRIARAPGAVREALAQVAGREQMIVRVYVAATPSANAPRAADAPPTPGDADPPSGAAYLVERARVRRAAAELPELAPLRAVFARFVAAERIDRHATPPLLASVYHLLPRGAAADYTAAVEAAAPRLQGVRVTVSGPWAAYAFAPDALAP
jgi:hypothetical protein